MKQDMETIIENAKFGAYMIIAFCFGVGVCLYGMLMVK